MTLPLSAVIFKAEQIRSASTGPSAAEISEQRRIPPGHELPSSGNEKSIFSCAKMPETLNDAAVRKAGVQHSPCVVPEQDEGGRGSSSP